MCRSSTHTRASRSFRWTRCRSAAGRRPGREPEEGPRHLHRRKRRPRTRLDRPDPPSRHHQRPEHLGQRRPAPPRHDERPPHRRAAAGGHTSAACGDPQVDCFDAGATSPPKGSAHARGWQAGGSGAQPNAPIARSVTLFNGSCADPYFSADSGMHDRRAREGRLRRRRPSIRLAPT